MSVEKKIMKQLENLDAKERQKVLEQIIDKYMSNEHILLGDNYHWWNNEEDDIYNEQ